MTSVSDGEGFIYTEEGHTFYQLSFNNANRTLVYDFTTQYWHERKSGQNRDLASMYQHVYGKHLVGDYKSGKIYEVSLDFYDEAGEEVVREGILPAISTDKDKITQHSLRIFAETGITPYNQDDPQFSLRWSNDGHKWGNWTQKPLGAQGNRNTKLEWTGLGSFEQRYYHWRTNVKAPLRLIKAYAD
jgi:hypothetical protein